MEMNKQSLFLGILGAFVVTNVWAAPAEPLVICHAGSCVKADEMVTAEALYGRLSELFNKNTGRKITFCDADPAIRLCYQQALKMPVSSQLLNADIGIDSADVLEVKIAKDVMSLSALLDMSVEANGTYPSCESSVAQVNVGAADQVSVTLNGFGCSFTSDAKTMMNLGFAVDYIDFENATIGGYYVMDASGGMQGKRTAYALMKLAEPVSGTFDLAVVPSDEVVTEQVVQETVAVQEEIQTPDCPPCVAEQVKEDDVVRAAIDAAARAEAEAKAAAKRAVKMAEEAAQTTSEYAQKKAEEAAKAKQEAEKAAKMAEAARLRVDNKVAAMNCQTQDNKASQDGQQDVLQTLKVTEKAEVEQFVPTKTVVKTVQKTVKHIDADGNVTERVISDVTDEQTVVDKDVKPVIKTVQDDVLVTTATIPVSEKSLSEEVVLPKEECGFWNGLTRSLGKIFWLE